MYFQIDFAVTGGLATISEYINSNTEFQYETYTDNVKRITNKLGFKVGGFADKDKLKLVLDSLQRQRVYTLKMILFIDNLRDCNI